MSRHRDCDTESLRLIIAEHIPAIIERLAQQAADGDCAAARLLLERVLPPIKASEQLVSIDMPTGSLAEQGRSIVAAAGAGKISPTQASQLLGGLSDLAKLIESDELAARIEKLEKKHVQMSLALD